jgi:protocatechuate 3,4-dioxygenase, alpha subunit
MPEPTPPQTVGPFFRPSLLRDERRAIRGPGSSGEPVALEGRVLDGKGDPIGDAMVEVWQANAHGRYRHPFDTRDAPLEEGFFGFGRVATDRSGGFRFETVRPGAVPWPEGGWQAPHLNLQVFARGLLDRLSTRVYFDGDPANDGDPVLRAVPADRRSTLLARPTDGAGTPTYRLDIVLQGPDETVFFDA